MKRAGEPDSLRRRLRRRVLLPLALTALASTTVVMIVSTLSTSQAFDRALLDDAYAIAAHVGEREGRLVLELTEREIGAALFDRSERVVFTVWRPDGSVLAGDPALPRAGTVGPGRYAFGHGALGDEPLRTVTLERDRPQPFVVTVAHTTRERTQWLARLVGYALLPQALLLALLGWWLGRSITEELEPLGALQRAVDRRDSTDLAPLDIPAHEREVAALARALNALMQRVGEGVAAQREFTGNVAHELRTPLAGIRALATYGLAHQDPAVWRRQLEAVAASEERASRLVDQLLALALADEARDGLPLGPVALDEVVHATVLRCWPRAEELGVELGASGLDRPLRVHGHVALIEGAVDNLVHNALRHGRPADGRPAALSVDVAPAPGGEVRVAVTDNGPGICADRREQLLRRWAQGERPALGRGQGAGLGLAIAARYAALMGGRLALEDGPGGVGLSAVLHLNAA